MPACQFVSYLDNLLNFSAGKDKAVCS